jgi:hypothetical protein
MCLLQSDRQIVTLSPEIVVCITAIVPQLFAASQTLTLAETFTIANASTDIERTCVVTLEHEGITAYGEGAPVDYWGESTDGLVAALEADGARLLGDDLWAAESIAERLRDWRGPMFR